MDALYAHVRFDDLDARSQSVDKGNRLSTTKQAISIKLARTVGLFLCDLLAPFC